MEIYHFDKETFNLLLSIPAVRGTLDPSTMLYVVLCSHSAKLQSPPGFSHQHHHHHLWLKPQVAMSLKGELEIT